MSGYKIVIEKAKGNYSAYAPGLPGCVATGSTREAARKNLLKAIEFHLEGLDVRTERSPAATLNPRKAAG